MFSIFADKNWKTSCYQIMQRIGARTFPNHCRLISVYYEFLVENFPFYLILLLVWVFVKTNLVASSFYLMRWNFTNQVQIQGVCIVDNI